MNLGLVPILCHAPTDEDATAVAVLPHALSNTFMDFRI